VIQSAVRTVLRLIVLAACCLLLGGQSTGPTLYISPAGNDGGEANNCQTETMPCATFAHAAAMTAVEAVRPKAQHSTFQEQMLLTETLAAVISLSYPNSPICRLATSSDGRCQGHPR
jgi:hypothetical protein